MQKTGILPLLELRFLHQESKKNPFAKKIIKEFEK